MIHIPNEIALDFDDVRIKPQPSRINSRSYVNLITNHTTLHSKQNIQGVPIISANMSSVSSFQMANALADNNMFCALHKHYSVEEYDNFFGTASEQINNHVFYTAGINDFTKLRALSVKPKLVCLDVANGYMESFVNYVSKVRDYLPESVIMAGNVVTAVGVRHLVKAGADIVKVGIGSGSVCQTRIVAGVGVPQLTAILDTVDAANAMGALICSDGGISQEGHFSIAFIAGAHFVMSGGMFAGHTETGLPVHIDDTGPHLHYYGMSSEHAMNLHNGGMASYRASEGKLVKIPYKGDVQATIDKIMGGIRSAGTYIDAANLQSFPEKGKLIRVRSTHNKIYGE